VEALARVCAELAVRSDLDHSAQLHVSAANHDELQLDVVLTDGRSAQRRVSAPDELMLTVEALLALPAVEAAPPVPPPPAAADAGAQQGSSERPPAESQSAQLGVELSAELMMRVARAPTYLSGGFALFAGILPGDWWLGLSLRWEPGQALMSGPRPPDYEMDSVAAGLLVARRLATESGRLYLGLSVLVVAVIQSSRLADLEEDTHTAADVRLGAVCRLLLGGSPWGLALSLDLDVSPLRAGHELHLTKDLPALPAWSAGFGFGGAWEDR
jgi:hypothetical protein